MDKLTCKEAIARLLELVEGELDWQWEERVRQHLAECEKCRSEYERLRCAADAIVRAVAELAPPSGYRSRQRVERLMAAYVGQPKPIKLVTLRRLVACAAAAAILVCVPLIVSDIRSLMTTSPGPVEVARDEADQQATQPVLIVLASTKEKEPLRPIRQLLVPVSNVAARERIDEGRPRFVSPGSSGMIVPVDHAFYDPEESSHWW